MGFTPIYRVIGTGVGGIGMEGKGMGKLGNGMGKGGHIKPGKGQNWGCRNHDILFSFGVGESPCKSPQSIWRCASYIQ